MNKGEEKGTGREISFIVYSMNMRQNSSFYVTKTQHCPKSRYFKF